MMARSRGASLIFGWGLVIACGSESVLLETQIPLIADDQSLIVSVAELDRVSELRAYAVQDRQIDAPWLLSYRAESQWTLHALTYQNSLSQLGLTAGPLGLAGPDEPRRPLPRPDRILQSNLMQGAIGDWETEDTLAASLAAVRLPANCAPFQFDPYPLPGGVLVTFMVVAHERLLMGNLNGELYLAQSDGQFRRLEQSGLFYDAYVQTDGTMYLGGPNGRISRARWTDPNDPMSSLELTDLAPLPSPADVWYIDGNPASGTSEHFVGLSDRSLHRFQNDAWTQLLAASDQIQQLVWLGPDFVQAVIDDERFVIGYDQNQPTQEIIVNASIPGGITFLARVDPLGAVAGTGFGQLYVRNNLGDWNLLSEEAPAREQIRGIHAYDSGMIFVRETILTQVLDQEICAVRTVVNLTDRLGNSTRSEASDGGRAELSVVGREVVIQGQQTIDGQTVPVLFWFRP